MLLIEAARAPVWEPLERMSLVRSLEDLEAAMRRVSAHLPSGWPIGLERSFAQTEAYGLIVRTNEIFNLEALSDMKGDPNDPKYHYVESELVLMRNWDFSPDGVLNPMAAISDIAYCLLGLTRYRTTECEVVDTKYDTKVRYENPDLIPARMDRFFTRINSENKMGAIYNAIGFMMEFLGIHPYIDGNGRIARAIFQLSIARHLKLAAPVFPLLPLMIYQRDLMILGYLNWRRDGDCSVICKLVEDWLWALVCYWEYQLGLSSTLKLK